MSVDFKADLKKLFGQSQFPVAKARGKIDVTAKGKFATLDPTLLNQLYFGQAQTTGMTIMAVDETGTIGSGSPVVYTVQVTNNTTFQTDYGVVNALTGVQFEKVDSAATTGQYSVDPTTGTYTFATADAGTGVLISYTYTSATRGATITLTNQLMGYAPEFRAFLFEQFPREALRPGTLFVHDGLDLDPDKAGRLLDLGHRLRCRRRCEQHAWQNLRRRQLTLWLLGRQNPGNDGSGLES